MKRNKKAKRTIFFIFELKSCFQIQYLVINFNNFLRRWVYFGKLAYSICRIKVNRLRAILKLRCNQTALFWYKLRPLYGWLVQIIELRAYIWLGKFWSWERSNSDSPTSIRSVPKRLSKYSDTVFRRYGILRVLD